MAGYTIAELPVENINIRTPEAYRADKASAIDGAVRRGKLPPGMAKNPTHTPALDRISASMQARNAPKPKIGMMKQAGGIVKSAGGAATLAAVPWGVMKAAQVGGADVPDAAVDHPLEFIGTGLAQAYADKMPEFMGGLPKSTVDSARAAGISAFDGTRFDVNQPAIAAPQPAAGQPAAPQKPAAIAAGLPSAEQVASDKARVVAAEAKRNAAAAESTLPAGMRGANGTLNSKALADSAFTADNDALLAEQAGRFAQKFNGAQGAGRFNDPAAAETFYQNRTASEFSPQMVDIVNQGIRARQNTPQSVAADNARFAMDGHGGVTKSVGKDGRVSYGDSAPNPFIASNFSNGKTGAQNMAARQASDAVNLKAGQERAAADKAELSRIELTRAALGGNNNAASILNNQGANEVNKLRIAADLAPKPVSAYDQERTRGAKMENDRSSIMDGLLAEFMGAKDDKARESALAKLNAINGKNAGADKYIMGEVEAGVDALGNPIMRKTPFNTRTGQYVGMEGTKAAPSEADIAATAKKHGMTNEQVIARLKAEGRM